MRRKKAPTVDISLSAEALGLPFSEKDWKATPTVVRHFIIECEKANIEGKKTIAELSEHVEELERRIEELLNRDSSNSDQPPSSAVRGRVMFLLNARWDMVPGFLHL